MTILSTPFLSLNGKELMFLRTSSPRLKKVVVLREQHSLVVRKRMFPMLGTFSRRKTFQLMLTGETWTERTTCPGPRISIFHSTAAHAGHRVLHPQSLTDLTFLIISAVHLSVSTHKLLLTARLVVPAMVETQLKSTSMHTLTVLFTHLASNTQLTTCSTNVAQLMSAVTVCGHHPALMMMVFLVASRLHQMSITTFQTTMQLEVLIKWKLSFMQTDPSHVVST